MATDLKSLKSRSAADRRAVALEWLNDARARPYAADWREIAEALALCVPTPKAKAKDNGWVDYSPARRKTVWPLPVLTVTFADGRMVKANILSQSGKPANWGPAVRFAVALYRHKVRGEVRRYVGDARAVLWADRQLINVPEISHIEASDGANYPVDVANAETASLRAGRFDVESAYWGARLACYDYHEASDPFGEHVARYWHLATTFAAA